jgi:hypothetical protein
LGLANLYLKAGDQDAAIKALRIAAKQMSAVELDLEPLVLYRKILGLQSLLLPERASVRIREAQNLLVQARERYQSVFESQFTKDPLEAAVDRLADGETTTIEENVGSDTEASEPELKNRALDLENGPGVSLKPERAEESDVWDDEVPSPEASQPVDPTGLDGHGGSVDALTVPSPDVPAPEIRSTPASAEAQRAQQVDPRRIQVDDDLETILSESQTDSSSEVPPDPDVHGEPDREDALNGPEALHEKNANLLYQIGLALFQMDLIEEATKKFTQAYHQGIRPVESLLMLARCYCRSGWLHHGADCIRKALARSDLNQEQIDALNRELEEIQAKSRSATLSTPEGSGRE